MSSAADPRGARPSPAWWPALAALAPWALLAWRFRWVCDDAFISFRYSKHLAQGRGLVYNLGDFPAVEGYSNFLWTVIAAGFERVGLAPATWMPLLSALCGAWLLVVLVRFAQRALSLSPLAALATGLFLGTLPTFALWSTSGLESMPACLLGFLAFERLLGDPERPRAVQAGLAAAVLALVRADGAVFALLLFGVAGATWLLERRPALLRATAVATSILVLVVALHVAWRVSYYGDFAPNTARVKAGFSAMRLERGGNYLTALLLAVPSIPLAYALSLLPSARPKKTLWLQCQAFLWVNAAYAVWPGGDFMPFGRFLLPSAPFLALLFAGFVAGSSRARPAPALAASGALVALSLLPQWDVHPIPESVRERFHFRWGEDAFRSEHERWTAMRRNALLWSDVGRALALIARPGESLIETRIGAIGYYSGLVILDGFGLVNRELEELDVQPARTTPGHDRRVPIERWLRYSPTYSQPAIVGPLEAERSLDEWNATHRGAALPWQGRGSVRLLARELPEDMGFRRGAILTVYRYE